MVGRTEIELTINNESARLFANWIIFYNPALLSGVYERYKKNKQEDEWLKIIRLSPACLATYQNENKRNRKRSKRGRKRLFDKAIFKERFRTIERIFAWEDKFKRLLLRLEHHSAHHYGMKTIAYTMINLRHFCNP